MKPEPITIQLDGDATISGLWLVPPNAKAAYVFAHGAGAGMAHKSMNAIAEGLARKIVEGQVPDVLLPAVIYSLDMGALLAGTRYRGDFEERLKNVVNELEKLPHAVLFIDEIHTVIGAGATSIALANQTASARAAKAHLAPAQREHRPQAHAARFLAKVNRAIGQNGARHIANVIDDFGLIHRRLDLGPCRTGQQ